MRPDRWLVIRVRVPSAELASELAEGLVALGGSAVHDEGDRLTTHVPEPADPEAFLERARHALGRISGQPIALDHEWRPDEDWTDRWRQGLRARRVGRRIVVAPPWDLPEPRADDLLIVIEPKMAFGTAEHPSTRGALRLLEHAVRPGDRVLDMGTGSGILAIAAVRLGASSVLAVDDDGDAIAEAIENIESNAVADRVRTERATVDADFLAGQGPDRFDVIAANVLSGVLRPLLPAFRASLAGSPAGRPAGRLVLAGILEAEAPSMRSAAPKAGLSLVAEDVEAGWWAGRLDRGEGFSGGRS